MLATKRASGAKRTVSVDYRHKFAGGDELVRVAITEGRKREGYYVARDLDSCDVAWSHVADESRSYRVTCTPSGGVIACTCKGWEFTRRCKHTDATAALLAAGELDNGPQPDAGYPEGWGWDADREQEGDYWRAECGDSLRVGCR